MSPKINREKAPNILGINCSVNEGLGRLIVVILTSDGVIYRHVFKSPSVFSFSKNSGEILNWHRENILSLITQFNIDAIAVKKTEIVSMKRGVKKSGVFKLYMEGVMLSLAGSYGIFNKHFYTNDLLHILNDPKITEKTISSIATSFKKDNQMENVLAIEAGATRDTLLSVLALEKMLSV